MPLSRAPRAQRPVRRAGRWIAGGALVALLVADASWAQGSGASWTRSDTPLAGFAGHWLRTEVERDDAQRHAEIERVTETMSFVLRGLARSVMRRRMRPDPEITLTLDADALAMRVGGEDRPALRPDGIARTLAEQGEVTDRWLPDGRIERTWNRGGDEGHGVVVWGVADGDSRLVAHVVVMNPHYEGPMEYTTTYRRDGGTFE